MRSQPKTFRCGSGWRASPAILTKLPGTRVLDCRGVWVCKNVRFTWVSGGFLKQEVKKNSKTSTSMFTELGALVLNAVKGMDACDSFSSSTSLRSMLYKEAKTWKIPVFWASSQLAWTLVTKCPAPHCCAVCRATGQKAVNTSVLGIVGIGMDACDNVSCSTSVRSVLYKEAKTRQMPVFCAWTQYEWRSFPPLPPPPPPPPPPQSRTTGNCRKHRKKCRKHCGNLRPVSQLPFT